MGTRVSKRFAIFEVLRYKTAKWDKIIYYAHTWYRREAATYVRPLYYDFNSQEHYDFLNSIFGVKTVNEKSFSAIVDYNEKEWVQRVKQRLMGRNIILKYEERDRNEDEDYSDTEFERFDPDTETRAKDNFIKVRTNISIPKIIKPKALFPDDDPCENDEEFGNTMFDFN